MVPLVEDILCNARTGITKAVVTCPGRAVPFYGRHSMGEGLKADKARDATFLLTGAVTWVGKLPYLTADPMTIQEGKRAIAQAIIDCWIKARGPGHPHVNLLAQQPSGLIPWGVPLWKTCLGMAVLTIHHHSISPPGAGSVIGIGETRGLNHLGFLHLPRTMVSRAIEVHCQQHLQCHPDLSGQMDQGIPDEVDDTEKKPTWR